MTAGWNFQLRAIGFCLGLSLCLALASVGLSAPLPPAQHSVRPLRIAVLTPRNDAFWTLFGQIAQAAGKDLGVEVEWLPALNDPRKHLADALAALRRPNKPDALILKNYDGTGQQILEAAEKAGVYSLLIEEGFSGEQAQQMGRPRQKYKYWLGEFLPDNFESGYQLTQMLIAEAQQRFGKHPLQMVAIGGNMNEGSSAERIQGMMVALREHPEVILHEIAAAYWQADAARIKTERLLQAYPETRIIWTNNDTMPVGAADAVTYLRQKGWLKQQPLIGGQGTTPPAARDVWSQKVNVSVGGQFLTAGFGVVLLYDFLRGHDFASESTMMRLQLFPFNKANVARYYQAFAGSDTPNQWNQIDFRRFSKAYNPQLHKYNFGFQAILEQLSRAALTAPSQAR